jgi:hypothetical protein
MAQLLKPFFTILFLPSAPELLSSFAAYSRP